MGGVWLLIVQTLRCVVHLLVLDLAQDRGSRKVMMGKMRTGVVDYGGVC